MKTPTFSCRGPKQADIESLLTLMSQASVLHGLTLLPDIGENELRAKMADSGTKRWVVATKGKDVVGYATLEWGEGRWRRSGKLAMAVHGDYAGKGVGRMLVEEILLIGFRHLDLQRIELDVYADNLAARGLYERTGFEYEGLKRRVSFRDGAYVDGYCMAILNPDVSVTHIEAPESLSQIIEKRHGTK